MNKRLVFSVYDSKAEAFLQPFFCDTRGVAIRMFTVAVSDGKHDFCRFSEDYTLFELGEFDCLSGEFVSHPTPQSVVLASVLLASLKRNGGIDA